MLFEVIRETEEMAKEYFEAFGFTDEQIFSLIYKGKEDLEIEILKLNILIDNDNINIANINDRLHALKGLFCQLGNDFLCNKINEICLNGDIESTIDELRIIFAPISKDI